MEWSIRDETLHADGMTNLFRVFCDEHPRIVTDDFKKDIYDMFRGAVALEDKVIDLAFEMGTVEGLTAEEVKQYIRYIADRWFIGLGLKGTSSQRKLTTVADRSECDVITSSKALLPIIVMITWKGLGMVVCARNGSDITVDDLPVWHGQVKMPTKTKMNQMARSL